MQTVLICHNDFGYLNKVQKALEEKGFDVDSIENAADLVLTGIRLHPSVIVVNPDMKAFNEQGVCKHLIQEKGIQVILVIDKHSTTRAMVGDCTIEDTVDVNTDLNALANLIKKHISVHQD
ncbi:MAG: hypothetical protein H0U44_00705 [Flavisolibacter sp.]|nr:hypothetical protein [Flavisolibacter sp.]